MERGSVTLLPGIHLQRRSSGREKERSNRREKGWRRRSTDRESSFSTSSHLLLPPMIRPCYRAYQTPICKSKRRGFKDTYPEDLLATVLKVLLDKTELNPNEVGDIVVSTVLAPGSQRATECRMAAFYAGFPETVPVRTVNQQCSSGLQALPMLLLP